jgi:hypothetical protein
MHRLPRSVILVAVVLTAMAFTLPASADHGSADEASPNMLHVANLPTPPQFESGPPNEQRFNSDLAFWESGGVRGGYDLLAQGNYDGFRLVDISDPENPEEISVVECRANQGDVSFYQAKNRLLLIQSIDRPLTDDDCATARDTPVQTGTNPVTGAPGTFFGPGFEGLRIFDVTDPESPVHIASVDTACGSHTHTTIPDQRDQQAVVYVSSYPIGASVTPVGEAPGPRCNPPHAKISIVQIPDDSPETPTVKEQPLHEDTLPFSGAFGSGGSAAVGCHDITAYYETQSSNPAQNFQTANPKFHVAGAACLEEGQLWDITDPENPTTLTTHSHIRNPFITSGVPGTFRGLFHTASFSNDGEIVLFTDEWGGGGVHGCDGPQDTRGNVWFYKNVPPGTEPVPLFGRFILPRPQPPEDACTMHNGNVITVSDESDGDFGVSSAYEAGTSVYDFSRAAIFPEIVLPDPPADPPVPPTVATEVAFYDAKAGCNCPPPKNIDDAWSSYWFNDYVYASSGLDRPGKRGLDVYKLLGVQGRLADEEGNPTVTAANVDDRNVQHFRGRKVRYMNPQTQDTFQDTSHGQ